MNAKNACAAAQGRSCEFAGVVDARGITGSMTHASCSGTSKLMDHAGLSQTSSTNRNRSTRTEFVVRGVLLLMLLGATNCEDRTDAQQKTAPSALVPAPVEVAPAQGPKLLDQAMLPPPSLSPELLPGSTSSATMGASSAKLVPSGAPGGATAASATAMPSAATTSNPKKPGEMSGIRVDTQTPGPMAPRTPRPADTM